jgi:hypothetical protein
MPYYPVKDVKGLYPSLVQVARLHQDEGDDRGDVPPYQITTSDLEAYFSLTRSKKMPAISIGGRTLTAFEIVELYRHLVYFDTVDSRSGMRDGAIKDTRDNELVTLPALARGYHFWGDQWTPARRLSFFLSTYGSTYVRIKKETNLDPQFPYSRMLEDNHADVRNTDTRPLHDYEWKFIEDLSAEINNKGFPEYSELLCGNKENFQVLEIRIAKGQKNTASAMEAREFGFTSLFAVNGDTDTPIYLVSYPQYGQRENVFAKRCRYSSGKDCKPLVGLNSRKDAIGEYVGPYSKGESLSVNGDSPDYKWRRMPGYLENARVYNYLRYDMNIDQYEFFKGAVLHEALHKRNTMKPDVLVRLSNLSTAIGEVKRIFRSGLSRYEYSHLLGYYLTNLQANAFEAKLILKARLGACVTRVKEEGRDPNTDSECVKIKADLQYMQQLQILAADAEEKTVEDEVYSTIYADKELHEYRWASEEGLTLNPNEIELLRREERAALSK